MAFLVLINFILPGQNNNEKKQTDSFFNEVLNILSTLQFTQTSLRII